MTNATLNAPAPTAQPETVQTAPPTPLTDAQQDSLIVTVASLNKPAKVKAGTATVQKSRAWTMGGRVD